MAHAVRAQVGLVTAGLATYWRQFPELRVRVQAAADRVAEHLSGLGVGVEDAGFVSEADDAPGAGSRLRGAGCDLVIFFTPTYMTAGPLLAVAQACGARVLVLSLQLDPALPHATADSIDSLEFAGIAGLSEVSNVLSRCDIPHDVVVGHLDDARAWQRVERHVRASAAAAALASARHGMLGHLYPGMLDVASNLTSLLRALGGYLEVFEMDDLRAATAGVTDEEAAEHLQRIGEDFDLALGVDREHLAFQARVAVGMGRLADDHRLDTLAYFHFGRDGDIHERIAGSMAIGGTYLTTAGIPVGTEYDVRATAAMHILNLLGATTMFTELHSINFHDETVEVGHDGATNLAMTADKPRIRSLSVFHGKSGAGNAIESTAAPGPVTHLALAEHGDGVVRMVLGEGRVVPGPLMWVGNTTSRVDFGCSAARWVEEWSTSGSGHHFAMGAGHHAVTLEVLARHLGVECTVVRPHD